MSDSEKTIRIRNTKMGVETTMLVDRWKLRNQRLQREGWVVVDPEELGIEVKQPAKLTTEEKVAKAQKDMGVKTETEQLKAVKKVANKEELEAIERKEPLPEPVTIPESDNKPETPDLESLNVKELKELADKEGVKYAKNAGKAKMIELLSK